MLVCGGCRKRGDGQARESRRKRYTARLMRGCARDWMGTGGRRVGQRWDGVGKGDKEGEEEAGDGEGTVVDVV